MAYSNTCGGLDLDFAYYTSNPSNLGSRISRSINVRYREPRMGEFDP